MRAVRLALAALLGLAVALTGAPAAFAAGASLALNPAQGTGREVFTATYRYAAGNGFCPTARGRVVFTWDGAPIGQAALNRQICGAQMRLRPPRNRRTAGQHRVIVAIPGVPGSQASAIYTVGTQMSPTPVQSLPSMDPGALPAADDTSPAALPAPTAGSVAPAAAANVTPGWAGWALVLGALLVLAGAGALGTLFVRSRRARAESPDPGDEVWY
jgi:hypothetical protein